MTAVNFTMQVRGYNANGQLKTYEGPAVRVLEFDDSVIVEEDTSSKPPRMRIRARDNLAARVDAIEAQLAGNGSITADSITVRRIIAKGTGAPPTPGAADLQIVTKGLAANTYDEVIKFVGKNGADLIPSTKMAWFGADAVAQQTVPNSPTADDIKDALVATNQVVTI